MNPSSHRVWLSPLVIPIALMVAAMACALFVRIGIFSWHDTHRIYQVFGLLGVLTLVFSAQARVTVFALLTRTRPVSVALGAAMLLGLSSAILSDHPGWACQEVLLYTLAMLALLLIAGVRMRIGLQLDDIILLGIGAFIGIYIWYVGLPLTIELFSGRGVRATHLMQGFDNPRFLGQFQTLTLPLLAALAVGVAGGSRLRLLWLSLMAFWWMLSFATGTRASWLALGVASLLALGFGRTGWRLLVSLALTAIVGFALYWLAFVANVGAPGSVPDIGLLARLDNIAGLSSRDILWGRAMAMWQTHPWLGVGPMHFAAYHTDIGMHPHSIILQWLAEWGAPATLLMGGAIAYGLVKLFKFAKRHQSPLAIALWMALLAAMVQAQVDGVFVMPNTQLWMILIAGWALGMVASLPSENYQPERAPRLSFWLAPLAMSSFVAYAWLTLPQIPEIHQREWQHFTKYPELLKPRFWRQGFIGDDFSHNPTPKKQPALHVPLP